MPRQLPWVNKGGRSRIQVKHAPQPAKRPRNQDEIEDEFFEGTALAGSRKGKERAVSDDDNSESWADTMRASRKGKQVAGRPRMPSSSPPPMSTPPSPPQTEYMRKGIDNFDLRDDEWMMVEDELLQTAKMFTRHLHLAEYERLKAEMEQRKKEIAARPAIPNARPSDEGRRKMKAREQNMTQKKAIRDFFAAASDDDQDEPSTNSQPVASRPREASRNIPRRDPVVQRLRGGEKSASDSDDFDTTRDPGKASTIDNTKVKELTSKTEPGASDAEFVKPSLPSNTKGKARLKRPTPFDMWDDFFPNRPPSPTKQTVSVTSNPPFTKKSEASTLRTQPPFMFQPLPSSTSSTTLPSVRTKAPAQSVALYEDLDVSKRGTLSKDMSDRLAKRKAEKERGGNKDTASESRKNIDDIPTFLF